MSSTLHGSCASVNFSGSRLFLDILMQNSLLFISKDFSSIIQFCPELWTLQTKGLNQENNYIELKGCSALCVKVLEILLEDWGSSHCFMNTLCRVYSIQKTCILFLLLAHNAQVHIHRVYLVDVYSQSSTVGEAVSTSSTHIFIPGLTSCCQQAHLLHLGHPHLETHKHILQFTLKKKKKIPVQFSGSLLEYVHSLLF